MIKDSKIIIGILSFITLILLGLVFLDIRNVRIKNEETSRLLVLAEEAASEKVEIQAVQSFRKQVSEEIDAFDKMVLTSDRLVPTIETIERAGRSLGLAVEITSVEKEEGQPAKISLAIETRGAWSSTLSFLHAIESLPHKVMINSVSFSKEAGAWRSNLSVSLYSFK